MGSVSARDTEPITKELGREIGRAHHLFLTVAKARPVLLAISFFAIPSPAIGMS